MFLPNIRFESFQCVTVDFLRSAGIEAVIYDIDETLAPRGVTTPSKEAAGYLTQLSRVFPVAFLSNNKIERVQGYNSHFGFPVYPDAKKPLKTAFLKAARDLGLPPNKIAVEGDQLFTDIAGGNRAGMYTILVEPVKIHHGWFYRLKRLIERIILKDKE